jgi:arylsulfatase
MIARWWVEAGKYQVLPIDGSLFLRLSAERPQLTRDRAQYVYYPGLSVVPYASAPKVFNRPHSITALIDMPAGGAEGVLLAQGGVAGGYALYVQDGRLHYVHNYMGLAEMRVSSTVDLPEGPVAVRYEFEPTTPPDLARGRGAGGRAQLYVDGALAGAADFDTTVPIIFGIEGLSCGYDFGEAVTDAYQTPFRFTGTIDTVTVDLSGDLIRDTEAEIAQMMAQQ